ncbi:hypothetical protein TrLO_g7543 [Triparma laevis f. longispina]|uniref:TNFR-Cys domain-containing protein n=1 Tax=Triparma laevis f. longispina TaxID=1714387 RepID=A0A9W7CJ02_9STRA|nr:hypothetical protein TrLO_g7543 [Triparma laevis f. longispina]
MMIRLFLLMSILFTADSCGSGRYCASENMFGTNQCSDCPAGYYCPGQSDSWACWGEGESGDNAPKNQCPAGTFSLVRSSTCSQCPAGTDSLEGSTTCSDVCVASTSPSDDGSDGNFYCINGGTVGGYPWSCTCTSCNTGFGGSNCESEIVVVDSHNALFHAISNAVWSGGTTGNNIVPNGAIVRAAQGTYIGAPYSTSNKVYAIDDIYFSLICSSSPHSCILDGADSRRIMYISGTSSQTLTIAGMTFKDGNSGAYDGGGMYIGSSALVSIQTCKFVSCSAGHDGGGIHAMATVNIYTTTFSDNSASLGNAIATYSGGDVTIHSTCPPNWTGNPTEGSSLQATEVLMLGKISYPRNSYDLGTCNLSCSAGKYRSSGPCFDCDAGNFSSVEGSISCLSCSAGQYSGPGSTGCSNCTVGKYLTESTTGVETSACSICAAGTYSSSPASPLCTVCPAGKYIADKAEDPSLHDSISDCQMCSAGTKLEDDGDTASLHDSAEDCVQCGPNFYSNEEETQMTSCKQCPGDEVSPAGASKCSSCPAGYDCSGGETAPCDAGTYSNGDTHNSTPAVPCQPCEKGYSCPGGTDHSPCRQGSYQPDPSKSTCLSCPAGKYQLNPGNDTCADCTVGHFCPERTVNPIPCGSAALYCPLNSDIVQAVKEGNYSTGGTEIKRHGEAICEAGFACNGGVKSSCGSNGPSLVA